MFRAASLLDIHLETGRTHQIRVHFAALHHPCAGDLTYGADPVLAKRLGLERQWLHARSLAFAHPDDGRRIEITSPTRQTFSTLWTFCATIRDRLRRASDHPGTCIGVKPSSQSRLNATGLLCAFGAYGLWGLFPPFFGALQPATAPEIMAHRIIWTFVFMAAVIAVRGVGEVLAIRPRTWLLLVCASALISCNWLLYVYAVNSGHVVDTAFGYFVNPLVSVFLGVVLFGERLNRAQSLALSIALAAVIVLSLDLHGRPLIALGLAVSFALYGAVKKVVPTDPRVSVGVEAALATLFAAAYLIWLHIGGHAQFLNHGPAHAVLLLLCGPVTAIPLFCSLPQPTDCPWSPSA